MKIDTYQKLDNLKDDILRLIHGVDGYKERIPEICTVLRNVQDTLAPVFGGRVKTFLTSPTPRGRQLLRSRLALSQGSEWSEVITWIRSKRTAPSVHAT
jgi:hypothetical protein